MEIKTIQIKPDVQKQIKSLYWTLDLKRNERNTYKISYIDYIMFKNSIKEQVREIVKELENVLQFNFNEDFSIVKFGVTENNIKN